MVKLTERDIALMIDHSVLVPSLTVQEAEAAILVGLQYGARSCCVRPADVPLAAKLLSGSETLVCTVIGFPHGSNATSIKVAEAKQAIADGAVELDMVLNIGRLRSDTAENDQYVEADIRAICAIAHASGAIVKVICENAYLNEEQKVRAYRLCEKAGADFVKTSTGFAPSGSTSADLKLMRATVGPSVRVKAAGGIRTLDALLQAQACGATRIGATATKVIIEEFRARTATTNGELEAQEEEAVDAAAAAPAAAAGAAPGTTY